MDSTNIHESIRNLSSLLDSWDGGLDFLVLALQTLMTAVELLFDDFQDDELFKSLSMNLRDTYDDPTIRKWMHRHGLGRLRRIAPRLAEKADFRESSEENDLYRHGNYSSDCGISESHFNDVTEAARAEAIRCEQIDGAKSRPHFLCVDGSVALLLQYLRFGLTPSQLAKRHMMAESTVRRTLEWILTVVRASLDAIAMPDIGEPCQFGAFNTIGSIDCTCFVRDRVHPGQDQYYRGDKRCHFLTGQVVVNHLGYILRVTIAKGHNNDKGLYRISQVAEVLAGRGWKLLADLGYQDRNLVTPIPREQIGGHIDVEFNAQQAKERVIVENVNSLLKNWNFLEKKCKINPYSQAMAIIVAAQLTSMEYRPMLPTRMNATGH
jgi:hypothetical protein